MKSTQKFFKNKKLLVSLCSVLAVVVVIIAVVAINQPHTSETQESETSSAELTEILENTTASQTVSIAPTETTQPSTEITATEEETVNIPEAKEVVFKPNTVQSKKTTEELIKISDSVKPTDKNKVTVNSKPVNSSNVSSRSVRLPVKFLAQNPELPTGCEITSLTTVLNYLGYNVSKTTMARNYLVKQEASANFWEVFVGNPERSKYSFGCYAQPITNAANKYLREQNSEYTAYNRSGSSFETLLAQVEKGRPVIIWGTMSMLPPYTTVKWNCGSSTVQWIAPEHCLVLIGYDLNRNVAIMSDPLKGIVEYNLTTVKSRYLSLHSQCVVLEKPEPKPTQEPTEPTTKVEIKTEPTTADITAETTTAEITSAPEEDNIENSEETKNLSSAEAINEQ